MGSNQHSISSEGSTEKEKYRKRSRQYFLAGMIVGALGNLSTYVTGVNIYGWDNPTLFGSIVMTILFALLFGVLFYNVAEAINRHERHNKK